MAEAPEPSSDHVRHRFQRQQRRDTAPEMALRRALHARGLRYRVDAPVVPGLRRRADLLFPARRVAVFVDGCFWHSCPEHGNLPRANGAWWRDKLAANTARDRDTDARLTDASWTVVRVWEHEVRSDVRAAADRVESAVRAAPHLRARPPT